MLGRIKFRTLALPVLALAVLVSASAATAGGTQLYAKGVRICKATVKLNHSTCFAMKRVFVKPTTPGARPYIAPTSTGAATIGPAGGLTPGDIVSAYHLATSGGAGQVVAIVDAYNDPNIQADLNTFDTQYGLTCSSCLTVHNMAGSGNNDQTGWSVEESLDVEAVHAVCPGCKILLVEASSNSDTDLAAAENYAASNGATEISNSFGGPEDTNSTFQSAFNHKGIVITASSGDDGYYDFDQLMPTGVNKPNTPAAYPTVIAVGGTSLYLTQNAIPQRSYETVWNDNGPQGVYMTALNQPLGAGGGGCSTLFNAAGWQSHMTGYSSAACAGKRLVTDISMVADPLTGFDIYDSYTCPAGCVTQAKWLTIGGTSLSSPLVAAAFGLLGGARGIPNPAVDLYANAASTRYDVTVGGNGICDGEGAPQCGDYNQLGFGLLDCDYNNAGVAASGTAACDAAPGFDGPSGVGTPNGMGLFAKPALKINAITGPTTATHNVSGGPWAITGTDPAPGGTITCTWNWGDGSSNSTGCGTNLNHTYASTGQKTITVTTHDQYGIGGATKTLIVTVS
jgi:hypothetical protein